MDRPANGLPEDLREHTRLMCDVIALALQTDKTRVASLLLARDLSALYYPFLDVRNGHHAASHDNLSDAYERIARFHLSQMAYLATKLDAMPEGDGTVVRLRHLDLPEPAREIHGQGWELFLGRLSIAAVGGDPGPLPHLSA